MTNKEAKEKLYMEWQKFLEDNIDYVGVSEAYKMAFKALEQEPNTDILDKLRTKIDLETRIQLKHYINTDIVIDAVLDVIDEYKAEKEE